ncbi:MAG: hypothetical protein JWQ66_1911 [Mucilaginibacter sp.]|nr:hypothetical protein [Mucilaginibacter sp.]
MRNTEFGDKAYRYKSGFRKKFIFIPFLVAGALALVSYIVMQLWNYLLPDILHTGTITFWQAMGLFILAKILFGFGHGGRSGRGGPWMQHRMERFKNMSPEEQERFREQMRSRCGKWGRHRSGFDWDQPAAKPAEDASKSAE